MNAKVTCVAVWLVARSCSSHTLTSDTMFPASNLAGVRKMSKQRATSISVKLAVSPCRWTFLGNCLNWVVSIWRQDRNAATGKLQGAGIDPWPLSLER